VSAVQKQTAPLLMIFWKIAFGYSCHFAATPTFAILLLFDIYSQRQTLSAIDRVWMTIVY
jgi:hypothetical protein